ncbi:HD domain-containing protein [Streptomyces sp. NPDC088733]|uniref:HD domain-containing protein n=1 Tax=Streptomyces sp. NPDC088733 TaxID=3365880 RepID=UPI0037F56963
MTPPNPLERALGDPGDPPMRPLPPAVTALLLRLQAPPRLAAHLRAVHDVAHELAGWTREHCPGLPLDREAVLFGAATHDIGKTVHEAELSGPGSAHEEAGRELLLAHGFPAELARFAGTHASWARPAVTTEELLVSTADKVWKNKRVPDLEDRLVARLAEANGTSRWEEFLALDDVLGRIGEQAGRRLAFQASFPVRG